MLARGFLTLIIWSTVYAPGTSVVNASESQLAGMETLVTLSYSHPLTTQMKKIVFKVTNLKNLWIGSM